MTDALLEKILVVLRGIELLLIVITFSVAAIIFEKIMEFLWG